jgi:hypothetical protein
VSIIRIAAVALAASVVVACAPGSPAATVDESLRRDLDLAASTSLELAPSGAARSSAMETMLLAVPEPVARQAAVVRSPGRAPSPAPRRAAVTSAAVSGDLDDSVVELASVETTPEAAPGGVALPRPAAVPVGSTSSGDVYAGGSRGPTTGEVIGVAVGTAAVIILRGGRVGIGDDDCELHRTGNRRPRYEPSRGGLTTTSRMPVVRGTFGSR